jgi:hypothetical protein
MSTYYNYNTGDGINLATEADRTITEPQGLGPVVPGLDLPPHDYITISPSTAPSSGNQVITYKEGGASGTTVATVTITYASGDVSTIVRS